MRDPDDRRSRLIRMGLTLAETLIGTLVIFVLLQTFVGRTYAVEQSSMQPTLEPEQRLIVDRLTPRFDPYKPGDIIVFDAPALAHLRAPAIKQIIATEGSVVELIDGRVSVDGVVLNEPYTYGLEPTVSVIRSGAVDRATGSRVRARRPPGRLRRLAVIWSGRGLVGDRPSLAAVPADRGRGAPDDRWVEPLSSADTR